MSVPERLRQGLDLLCKATGDPKVCGVNLAVDVLVGYPDPLDPPTDPVDPQGRGKPVKGPGDKPQLYMAAEKSRPGSRGTRVVDMAEAIAANYLQSMVQEPMMVPHGVPKDRPVRTVAKAPAAVGALQTALGGGIAAAGVTQGVIEHFRQRGGGGGRFFQTNYNPRRQWRRSGRSAGQGSGWGMDMGL